MKTLLRGFGLLCAITILVPVASAQKAPQQVSTPASGAVDAVTAAKLIKQPNVVVLDVRTPAEYATGHVRGAKNVDFRAPDFAQQIAQLDTTKMYMLYCASGNRSGQASKLMKAKGFAKVVDAGAFKTLQADGLKTE
ncbi:rhodanese-like domain-containing protein [Hymenobacter sp. BT188]|uniref:rhodanese-like domain-containing protein n=1 Tax=Hymenobacter sp. BT188 TaxID=2763504 RepID=UPI0016516656|nr:rhodanese-like domain-containing protein [Hymenobacter sp. BT188]MBC6607980.1 rhodanese-like domain-containing protein [Hymenobacter sp. BT188]